jgi:nucleoside-diphosphate-sugar epimerase
LKFTIFGSHGFIGSHLTKKLIKDGCEVVSFSRNTSYNFTKPLGHVFYCIGLTANFRMYPFATVEAHVCLLKKILAEACFESLTYLSSTRIYTESLDTSEIAPICVIPQNKEHIYNISKIMGESLCLNSGRNVKIARLSNVIGTGMPYGNFIYQILSMAAKNKKVTFLTSPESTKDYISIDDIIRWLPQLAINSQHSVYNLAYGKNISNAEIAALLEKAGIEVNFQKDAPTWKFKSICTKRLNLEFGQPKNHIQTELNLILKKLN